MTTPGIRLTKSTLRQDNDRSRMPTNSGARLSPMFGPMAWMAMAKPRLSGYFSDSVEIAAGCHK